MGSGIVHWGVAPGHLVAHAAGSAGASARYGPLTGALRARLQPAIAGQMCRVYTVSPERARPPSHSATHSARTGDLPDLLR